MYKKAKNISAGAMLICLGGELRKKKKAYLHRLPDVQH